MVSGEPGPYQIMRNEETLKAHRKRVAAAGAPFFLLPAVFNPAIYLPLLKHSWPGAPLWVLVVVFAVWLALVCASWTYGWRLRQRFQREHPLDADLRG